MRSEKSTLFLLWVSLSKGEKTFIKKRLRKELSPSGKLYRYFQSIFTEDDANVGKLRRKEEKWKEKNNLSMNAIYVLRTQLFNKIIAILGDFYFKEGDRPILENLERLSINLILSRQNPALKRVVERKISRWVLSEPWWKIQSPVYAFEFAQYYSIENLSEAHKIIDDAAMSQKIISTLTHEQFSMNKFLERPPIVAETLSPLDIKPFIEMIDALIEKGKVPDMAAGTGLLTLKILQWLFIFRYQVFQELLPVFYSFVRRMLQIASRVPRQIRSITDALVISLLDLSYPSITGVPYPRWLDDYALNMLKTKKKIRNTQYSTLQQLILLRWLIYHKQELLSFCEDIPQTKEMQHMWLLTRIPVLLNNKDFNSPLYYEVERYLSEQGSVDEYGYLLLQLWKWIMALESDNIKDLDKIVHRFYQWVLRHRYDSLRPLVNWLRTVSANVVKASRRVFWKEHFVKLKQIYRENALLYNLEWHLPLIRYVYSKSEGTRLLDLKYCHYEHKVSWRKEYDIQDIVGKIRSFAMLINQQNP
ncbi:MAG: hypothetical protein GXO48_02385 [Chlorobi bacterium]|nr:hypothetical protein [Chlorobiota bacterium]